ncbi:HI1506-related protein [Lonsdalea britannica]|uniref:HI1506-related protein n=1 Tax=Lonsdalea britannica TaxID=1082704 RepID=UPI0026EA8B2E|nr:HI1506-related protein [Lonsdalea britannica]
MPIQITAKREGFRRCGIAHSETTKTYPDNHFTAEQLAKLESESMLVVVRVSDEQAAGKDLSKDVAAARGRIVELEGKLKQAEENNKSIQSVLTAAQENLETVTAERDALIAQLAETTTDKAKK